jgi:hypothetical protein
VEIESNEFYFFSPLSIFLCQNDLREQQHTTTTAAAVCRNNNNLTNAICLFYFLLLCHNSPPLASSSGLTPYFSGHFFFSFASHFINCSSRNRWPDRVPPPVYILSTNKQNGSLLPAAVS